MKKLQQNVLLIAILILTTMFTCGQTSKIEKLKWINFSPYVNDWQNPNYRTVIPKSQITALIDSILPYTEGIRIFGTTDGLERFRTPGFFVYTVY